jgi:Uma2 family endonuclease
MSVETIPIPDAGATSKAPAATWRWTVEKYDWAYRLGWFAGQRVELIEGRVLRMPPQLEPHVVAVVKSDQAAARAFGEGYTVRRQAPIVFGRRSKPEPDVAVVPGLLEDTLRGGCPRSALLIIEVSEKTLAMDRTRKLALYAKNSIQDYWIVNLVDWQLEVYRQPTRDTASRHGYAYAEKCVLQLGQEVSPLARPAARINVAELFPTMRPPAGGN